MMRKEITISAELPLMLKALGHVGRHLLSEHAIRGSIQVLSLPKDAEVQ